MDSRVSRRIKGRGAGDGSRGPGPKALSAGRDPGMSPSILFSALLHALVIALVVYFPTTERKVKKVELIAVTLASKPGPMGGGGKSPEVVEPPKKEVKETPPDEDTVKVPDKRLTDKPSKTPPRKEPEPSREIPKAPVGPGQGPVGGGPRDAVQGPVAIDGGTGNFKFTWYIAALQKKVEANWSPPALWANARPKTVVFFRIDRAGRITDVEVEASSGVDLYDQKALLAIKKASPLPPLPEGYEADRLGVHYTFMPRG
ncbi:MAG: TonB family protein [Nitrospirae bacterium]|nr:TonB family protein [Nitrospirota bacterium]